jgi:hypothetical protein
MSELQCAARLKIHDGKLDEFKRLAAKCAELVRPGLIEQLKDSPVQVFTPFLAK